MNKMLVGVSSVFNHASRARTSSSCGPASGVLIVPLFSEVQSLQSP